MNKKKIGIIITLIFIIVLITINLTLKTDHFVSKAIKKNAKITETTTEEKIAEIMQNIEIKYSIQGAEIDVIDLVKDSDNNDDMEKNTLYLQAAINKISEVGGGVVHIPEGTYNFSPLDNIVTRWGNEWAKYIIKCKNNVLVKGAGTDETTENVTILKPIANNSSSPVDMFYYNEYADSLGTDETFLINSDYSDFIIDGIEAYAANDYFNSSGKGFMINLFKDCDWNNVVVKNTDGTGFGVDCPINSTIKNCTAINCGKGAKNPDTKKIYGASGFGIGTGYCNEESIIIIDCEAKENKKFGFFFEHQARFTVEATYGLGKEPYGADKSESFVVSNCSASGNLYDFGGVRANDVTYENCVSEANDKTVYPIYFEQFSVRSHIVNCETNIQFSDVSDSSQEYYNPVYWAVNNSITTGISKTLFAPENKATRAQALTMLWRMADRPGSVEKQFTTFDIENSVQDENIENKIRNVYNLYYEDVAVDSSYVEAVIWAIQREMINNEDTNFYPDNECTRAEFIEMMWKYAGQPTVETKHNFEDINSEASYNEAVNWAVEKRIVKGEANTKFNPNNTCTRGEIVTLLYKYAEANNNFDIKYNLNAGIFERENPSSYQAGTDAFVIKNPIKTGYTFEGWTGSNYKEYEESSKYIPQKNVEITTADRGNKTYTANWTANNYKVSFDANGGIGEMSDENFIYDFPQVLSQNQFTRNGYIFKGWSINKDGTDSSYDNAEVVMNLTSVANEEITLYAQWEPVEYKVEYYKQNIDGTYSQIAYETENLIADEIKNAVSKSYDGFTFSEMQIIEVSDDGGTETRYYYYTRNSYTVTINKGKGIERTTGEGTYKYEEQVTLGAELKEGYENITWTGDYTANSFTMPAKDIIIQVNAQEIEFAITSSNYNIVQSYISEILDKTTVERFKNNINTNATQIQIVNNNNQELNSEDIIGTGMEVILKLGNITKKYKLIVKGDVNSDGYANLRDILFINKHRLNKIKLENEYMLAGDVTGDNIINIKDILKINKYRLKKISIL